jgi:hypothetical protein
MIFSLNLPWQSCLGQLSLIRFRLYFRLLIGKGVMLVSQSEQDRRIDSKPSSLRFREKILDLNLQRLP